MISISPARLAIVSDRLEAFFIRLAESLVWRTCAMLMRELAVILRITTICTVVSFLLVMVALIATDATDPDLIAAPPITFLDIQRFLTGYLTILGTVVICVYGVRMCALPPSLPQPPPRLPPLTHGSVARCLYPWRDQ